MCTHYRRALAPALACLLAIAFPAAAEGPAVRHVPGEKLDSGLGELPNYREWSWYPGTSHLVRANRVAGEKLDSGLGELKHYRYWADNTGRVRETVEVASRH